MSSAFPSQETPQGTREAVIERFNHTARELGSLARRTIKMDYPDETDAIAVFLGLGEQERFEEALKLWREGRSPRLLIANSNPTEPSHMSYAQLFETIESFGLDPSSGVSVLNEPVHTKDQADWIATVINELKIKKMALVTPDYHTPRAYATTIDSLRRRGAQTAMYAASIDYPKGYVTPDGPLRTENDATPENMATLDAQRIVAYQAKGDVASNDEWQRYLDELR